jgi:hypothetical protein
MLTDTQIESMLEEHFEHFTEVVTKIDARSVIVNHLRRRRTRTSFVTVAAASAGLVLALGLAGGGRSPGQTTALKVHLGSHTFRLPSHFQLVDDSISHCWSVAVFQVPFSTSTAVNDGIPYTNEVIANDIDQQGSCVAMGMTVPYFSNSSGLDPFEVSGSQPVSIGSFSAWVYTTTGFNGVQEVNLGVEVPDASGQYHDIVIGALGLSESTVESIVASGLSTSSQ